ncbi:TIGR04190 family B12-binding domain/radical SAM domain protein, partial [bacterium]|nr:TIGR04190 family B12-binding domain/radical SAM domain protein [bacterium]
ETSIQAALAAGCGKFDVFFMIGLPQQTTESVMETVDYCEKLLQQFGKKVTPFISPLAPFLDPGSRAYENPEEHGYRVFFRTLEQHRQALLQPSWKYMLNYETQWMDREALVQATYEAGRRLTEIKARFGVISDAEKKHTLGNLSRAIERNQKIDDFYRNKNAGEPVLTNMEQDSISTICHKRELRWPNPSWSFRIWNIIKAIILE